MGYHLRYIIWEARILTLNVSSYEMATTMVSLRSYCVCSTEFTSLLPWQKQWKHSPRCHRIGTRFMLSLERRKGMKGKHLVRLEVCLRNCWGQPGITLEMWNSCAQSGNEVTWQISMAKWTGSLLSQAFSCIGLFFFLSVKRETRFSLWCRHRLGNCYEPGGCVYRIRNQKL